MLDLTIASSYTIIVVCPIGDLLYNGSCIDVITANFYVHGSYMHNICQCTDVVHNNYDVRGVVAQAHAWWASPPPPPLFGMLVVTPVYPTCSNHILVVCRGDPPPPTHS